jgi:hypothetical protein
MRQRVDRGLDHVARFIVERRRGLAVGIAVFVAAAVAFRWVRQSAGFWTIDDAGITYAAAFELVDHGSLAAYVEGTPVESYSNPLVFFVVAVLRWFGLFDPIATHLRVEMLVFALMVVLVWSALRRATRELAAVVGAGVFTTLQLSATPTWLWYGSGLENVWVAAGLIALLWLCVRTVRGVALAPAWGVVPFVVALTRPEAPVYVAGFYVALAVCARPPELGWWAHARQVALALAVTSVLYAAFLCWRRIGYGDWLPNTYYAKIFSEPQLGDNLRVAVFEDIVRRSPLVASAAIALLFVPSFRRIAWSLLVLELVSLALPITAGRDWGMGGGHRFSTPFLATSHASFAMVAAVCVAALAGAVRRRARLVAAVAVLVITVMTCRTLVARIRRPQLKLNEVTIARIAAQQGGWRWEHQMRLGVPYAVTMIPDAGGSLLVGGMQMLDNAYLADFVMAHVGRNFGDPTLWRQLNQYQHEERRPDVVDGDTAIGVFDTSYVGKRYLAGPGHLLARRDLAVVPAVDPTARLLLEDGPLRVYLSDETEPTAAPGALVRCELVVAWTGTTVDDVSIRGAVAGGDGDEISLRPYQPGVSGVERRALLLGAPEYVGPAVATIELVRGDRVIAQNRAFALDVVDDDAAVARAAGRAVADGSAMRAARRLAWLREQRIPRLGMTRFHRVVGDLLARDARRGSLAGEDVLRLRWNARLAALEGVPAAIGSAEVAVARRLFAACPAATTAEGSALRVACLGRVVDELRRLGYLGLVVRVPDIADELARARDGVERLPPEPRYQVLVGLTLADPSHIGLQRELIAVRRALQRYPELPAVTDRAAR